MRRSPRCDGPFFKLTLKRGGPMKRHLILGMLTAAALAFPAAASAQSGHFVTGGANAPTCTDIGLQVQCSGKVAGLGGTTFEIAVEAKGVASVVCINHGGNRA